MAIRKYILELAVFLCGAVVMIFELVGSRVLGPYFGTSIFIWTSLIGIILGSLSLGYYLGGKLADKKPTLTNLALIIFLAGTCIGLTTVIKEPVLLILQHNIADIRLGSILAGSILFIPASVLLGMVSPYAAKLRINSLHTSGATIGNLYALSTAGSIVGTFGSGFWLIPYFGTNKLLLLLASTLISISIILSVEHYIKIKLAATVLVLGFSWMILTKVNFLVGKNSFIDIDTAYNRIWIFDHFDKKTNSTIRTMAINNENSSAMFLENKKLVYDYTKYYRLAQHFKPEYNTTVMFGGAGYSYPKDFLQATQGTIDVVEIDPMVTELAQHYFNLQPQPRLHIYHEDGRVFLNHTQEKYDVIFGDAFSSHYSLPYQLTTREAIQKNYDILNSDGIVVLNIISAIEGDKVKFLRADYATYQKVFPQVYLFPVNKPEDGTAVQNIMLVALKSAAQPTFTSTNSELNEYLGHRWTRPITNDLPILTDDFAPVDYYISQTI